MSCLKAQRDALMEDAENGENARLSIDLEAQTITRPNGEIIAFDVDPFRKHCLLNGLDDIGLTLQKSEKIKTYEADLAAARSWV